jgi:spermidine synthase
MTIVLHACFLVSGAAGLALEMLWMRSAALAFGATAATGASVLGCYFAGLALGALVASRGSRAPVLDYGRLEIGVAIGAVWSIAVLQGVAGSSLGAAHPLPILAAALLPSTICLGATLPILGGALARDAVGRRGGILYAINTLGAVLGAAAAGFGLPAVIGVRATYVVAIGASAVVGVTALLVARAGMPSRTPPAATRGPDASSAGSESTHLLGIAAVVGALGLGLEVLWIRMFAQVLHNSVYSFTAVTIAFLLAITLGAAIAARVVDRAGGARVAATALLVAGTATVAGYWLFVRVTGGLDYVGMTSGLAEYVMRIVGLALLTAGPAALAGAAVLPALWHAADASQKKPALVLGRLSAANAAGGAVGALVAAFVVVPALGVRGGFLLVAVAFVLLAYAVRPVGMRWHGLAAAAVLLGIVVADPLRAPSTHLRDASESLRATLEGPSGIVTVVDAKDDVQLRLDTYYTLGGTGSAANERRQGLVPLLLHPNPRRVAFVGLATGITASVAPALGVPDTTVIELVPEVVDAARTHFASANEGLLERSDVHLVVDDGRRHLARTDRRYDVVVSDLFIPWHAGTGSLYAREMYETVAARLEPDGLFCQWLPLYQLTREEFDVIAHTFLDVFPAASLWRADFYADRPVVALVGFRTPRAIDLDAVPARVAALPHAMRDTMVASPRALAMLYAGDLSAVAERFAAAPFNTDDHPVIEFLAPRLTRMSQAGDKDWFTGDALAEFYAMLDAQPAMPTAALAATDEITAARQAGLALFRYANASARHDDRAARQWEATVRDLVPDVVASADPADEAPPSHDPQEALGRLHADESELRHEMSDMQRRLSDLAKGER